MHRAACDFFDSPAKNRPCRPLHTYVCPLCLCVRSLQRPFFVFRGKRILCLETVPGYSKGDELARLRADQSRAEESGEAGKINTQSLRRGQIKTCLQLARHQASMSLSICVSLHGRFKRLSIKHSLIQMSGLVERKASKGNGAGRVKRITEYLCV